MFIYVHFKVFNLFVNTEIAEF